MFKYRNLVISFMLMFCVVSYNASSEVVDTPSSSVEAVESYLKNLKTLKSRFTQIAYDGTEISGDFYLNRPGRLRFEYDDPIEDFIVADGVFIYFYDAEMKQQSNAPIGQTLANFILQKKIDFSDDITVLNVQEHQEILNIHVTQTSDPDAGSLILSFSQEPLQLKSWRIIDAQGLMTEIALDIIEENVKLDKKLFYYLDPEHKKARYNN